MVVGVVVVGAVSLVEVFIIARAHGHTYVYARILTVTVIGIATSLAAYNCIIQHIDIFA